MKKLSFKPKQAYKRFESFTASWDVKKLVTRLSVLAVLVGFVGAYLWYSQLYMTDERRFWMAIENSLSTPSVTRTLTSGGTGNQVIQDQQFFFTPQQVTRSHVSFMQKSATIDTAVETEGLSFVGEQYSRYTAFRTNQERDDGSVPTLDGILGKWEGSQADESDLEASKMNYVSELVSLAIFGNYDADFRRELIEGLRTSGAYEFTGDQVVENTVNDRLVRVMQVSVKLKAYAEQLQRAFVHAGYGEFAPLDPANYDEDATIRGLFTVDPRNNSLVGIQFGNRQEEYSGYGITTAIERPKAEFSGGELETIVEEEIQDAL